MTKNNLITLKEAAKISGYTPDYVGQLIRQGKIYGEQVYANIVWMTTPEAVLDYKNKKHDQKDENQLVRLRHQLRKISMQISIFKLFFKTFRSVSIIIAALFFCLIVLGIFLMQNISGAGNEPSPPAASPDKELTF